MSICDRVGNICQNKRKIICDTTFIYHFIEYIIQKKPQDPLILCNELDNILNLIRNCSCDNRIYCSQRVLTKEYKGTIFLQIDFLRQLNGNYQGLIKGIFDSNLTIQETPFDALRDLKTISNRFCRKNSKTKISKGDLSLLFLALENLKIDTSNHFLIVTDDTIFHEFITEIKHQSIIRLAEMDYDVSMIIPITAVSFLTQIYSCCLINNLSEFGQFTLLKHSDINNNIIRYNKLIKIYEWVNNDFQKAKLEKQRNAEAGICES